MPRVACRRSMTNLRPMPRDQEAEALYWLDLAKRVIGGEISPDDALQVLKSGDETLKRTTICSRDWCRDAREIAPNVCKRIDSP